MDDKGRLGEGRLDEGRLVVCSASMLGLFRKIKENFTINVRDKENSLKIVRLASNVGDALPMKSEVPDVAQDSKVAQPESADEFCEDCGYEPELLGSFQVFAVSFAFISVAVGVFATFDDVLQNAGPVGIWLFVLVAVGLVLVGGLYFACMLRFNREVLETEPGDPNLFAVSSEVTK